MRLLVATAVVFVALAPAASALTVIPGGGDPVVVNLAEVPHDEGNGVSLSALLSHLQIEPYDYKSFEVSAGGDDAVVLARSQAVRLQEPPLFYEDASGTYFDPRTGDGPISGDLTLRLTADSPLEVKMTVSTKRTEPGELVTFEAEPVRAPAGEEITYKWNFDDDDRASGKRVRHRFKEPGSYDVIVGMTTPSDAVGVNDIVTVRVGEETGGPDRKGGGRSSDVAAPDSGASRGATGGGTTGGGTTDHGPRTTEGPQTTDHGAAPRPESAPRERRPEPQPVRSADSVEGFLLSSATSTPPRRQAARTGTPRTDGARSVPEWVWAALVVSGLLGCGLLLDRTRLNWGTPSP